MNNNKMLLLKAAGIALVGMAVFGGILVGIATLAYHLGEWVFPAVGAVISFYFFTAAAYEVLKEK